MFFVNYLHVLIKILSLSAGLQKLSVQACMYFIYSILYTCTVQYPMKLPSITVRVHCTLHR